jgi:large subunit ribosomal protein L6
MSRIGKLPVGVPSGVTATVESDAVLVKGPKGQLRYTPGKGVKVVFEGGKLVVSADTSNKQTKADFGSARAHLNNMVKGVSEGWKRSLELNGVGFNAKLQGQVLVLSVGYSHEVKLDMPKEVKCVITKNVIELDSHDKNLVGVIAARIRRVCPPEPYLGKGIKYVDETIRRKAGKTGKK